jgi:hypothetical protein
MMEKFIEEQMKIATENFKSNIGKVQKYHDETKYLMNKEGMFD